LSVLEPDPTSRVPPTHPAPGAAGALGPNALQILTTEHWSLLAARSLVYTEAMSRTSIFIAALTGSVVALAFVGQATEFGSGFAAFALVLLPVVYFLGFVTIVRLSQVNREDALWVAGMNRIRHAYVELAPELEPYFVTSRYDDRQGMLASIGIRPDPSPAQAFVAVPGVVAVLDSVVAGAAAGIAGVEIGLGVAGAVVLGSAFFCASIAYFIWWARRTIEGWSAEYDPLFPSPPASQG
jgi:hypothetical protein